MNLDEALQGFQDKSQMFNFEEDNTIIELSLTYEKLLEGKISRNDFYELFMASFWISRHKIHPRLKVSADKGENILVELNRGWPLRAVDQIYDIHFLPKICDECRKKIDSLYQNLKAAIADKSHSVEDRAEESFELLAKILVTLCSECIKKLKLQVSIQLEKLQIEKAIEDEISKEFRAASEYVFVLFWIDEKKFLDCLGSDDVGSVSQYLSGNEKQRKSRGIPLVVIPNTTLKMESQFFYVLPSWNNFKVTEDLKSNYIRLESFYEKIHFLPPQVLFQDEILDNSVLRNSCWRLMIYLVFRLVSDSVKDSHEKDGEILFEIEFDLMKKSTSLKFLEGEILLGPLSRPLSMDSIEFASLRSLNEKYMESLNISSHRRAWKTAFKEVLDLRMDSLLQRGNADKVIEMYERLVDKAFDSEFVKLAELLSGVGKSTSDILDRITNTISSVSSEVHNSSLTVFGALVVQIVAILSKGEENIIWFLGILLVTLFIVFYIPMVNRKINGLIIALRDTKKEYARNVMSIFGILNLPNCGNFRKIRILFKNVNRRWSNFLKSVNSEVKFLRFVSIALFLILIGLVLLKPKTFEDWSDWFIIFTPVMVLISIPLWKIYMKNEFPQGCSVHESPSFVFVNFVIGVFYPMLLITMSKFFV